MIASATSAEAAFATVVEVAYSSVVGVAFASAVGKKEATAVEVGEATGKTFVADMAFAVLGISFYYNSSFELEKGLLRNHRPFWTVSLVLKIHCLQHFFY